MRRGFAILDFETTGLAPKRGDRVVEVATVCTDPELEISGSLETLLNPQRDVGPTSIHGITARDVYDAPTFHEVAPALLELLDGRVIVGHNISFDLRFLTAELLRAGYEAPEFVAIDTLSVARSLLRDAPPPTFQLHDICSYFGFGIPDIFASVGMEERPEHSALGDVMVTTRLMSEFVRMSLDSTYWQKHMDLAERVKWPEHVMSSPGVWKRRGDPCASSPPGMQSRSTSARSRASKSSRRPDISSTKYTQLLEESLADRVLDSDEVDELADLAQSLGLDEMTLGSLHRGHFDSVVQAAWDDGVLTEEEKADILHLADLLSIDSESLSRAIAGNSPTPDDDFADTISSLPTGSIIVLTGEMSVGKSVIAAEATALGFTVGDGVTKKTALVIAADPYSQSGKAKKAHQYGIPVLGEQDGLSLLRQSANQP